MRRAMAMADETVVHRGELAIAEGVHLAGAEEEHAERAPLVEDRQDGQRREGARLLPLAHQVHQRVGSAASEITSGSSLVSTCWISG